MTQFTKENFVFGGVRGDIYVTYETKFVARFKYGSSKAAANAFVKFLIKNFTVEEYFTAYDNDESPSEILEQKGYVDYNIKKILRKEGYPLTNEGKRAYFNDLCAKLDANA